VQNVLCKSASINIRTLVQFSPHRPHLPHSPSRYQSHGISLVALKRQPPRAVCEQAMVKHEAEGKMNTFDREVRPTARDAIIKTCIAMDRFSAPPTPTAYTRGAYTRGLAALDGGDLDAAIAEFTAAIADDPKDTFSYIRRGRAYEKKG